MRQSLTTVGIPPVRDLVAIVLPRRQASTPEPSPWTGMGALSHPRGTSFRVWAPHAHQVYVSGTFNRWSPDAHPMAPEDAGLWSLDIRGVKPGARYKYRIISGDRALWRIDPYARAVTHSAGEGIVPPRTNGQEDPGVALPPREDQVIYELHIGTFYTPAGTLPATFDDARHQLPYLKELGVNIIEVMPPMAYPGRLSWGYNPAHIFAIDSDYGGPEAFRRYIAAAHRLGLAVVLDVVYNHFGPSDLDLWQFDGWSQHGLGGIYFYNDDRAVTPWGHTRPDYGRPEVRQFIRDNALMWLREYHLDGLRLDATSYIRNVYGDDGHGHDLPDGWRLLREINEEIALLFPSKLTIAEDLRSNAAITRPVARGGAGFVAQWDDAFVHPVRAALITPDDARRDLHALARAITFRHDGDPFTRVIYTESHDEVANGKARVPEEIWPRHAASIYAKKRSLLGAVLVFTTPGIPMIFQGQEFLSDAWFADTHPIDWGKRATYAGIQELYRDLIRLRHGGDGLTRGLRGSHVQITHMNHEAKVIVFHRWDQGGPGDSTMVILNLRNAIYPDYVVGLPASGDWQVRLVSDAAHYDAEFAAYPLATVRAAAQPKQGQPCQGSVLLRPYSALILSQEPPR